MTTGHLKCEYLLIWLRNMQNCEMHKIDIFSQVRGHEKLQFFRLSEKAFKMMKITTSWPQDTWNVNICSFGWEICKTVKCPKMTIFCRSAVMKIFKFFDFLESLLKWWKSPPDDYWTLEMWIFAHLVEKYAKLWNAQNWHFSQVRGHEKLQFFRLSEKAFKLMKITTSWPQDTWNVNICSFGWEICKTVKCPKMTIFRRSAVMKIFKFFDFLESLLKWWKSPPDDHWTLEMWIFAHLFEKYAKLWNAQNWHFFAGPRSWKSSIFSTFWKCF